MWPANLVWVPRVTAAEIAAGTGQDVRLWAVVDVKSMIDTWAPLAPGVLVNPMTQQGSIIYGGAPSGGIAPPMERTPGAEGAVLALNASGVPVWLPRGKSELTIAANITIDMSLGRVFTGTLTGAAAFAVSNTWGNRSFALRLTNNGTVAEPTWPTGAARAGTSGTWSTSNGAINWVFFTWYDTDEMVYSIGQQV